jgi:site-specific recombinase XerD
VRWFLQGFLLYHCLTIVVPAFYLMQKATIELILRESKKNDIGLIPVYLKITIDRDTKYYIQEKQWDPINQMVREPHAMASEYNAYLVQLKSKALNELKHANLRGETLTATLLKEKVSGKKDSYNIFQFAESYIKEIHKKRAASTIDNYRKHLRKLEAYHGSQNLNFNQVDLRFLQGFEEYLQGEGVNKRKNNYNYTTAIIKTLKSFFNAARKKRIISEYPFDLHESHAYEPGDKEWLTLSELDKWEKFAKTATLQMEKETAIYFLLGCYTGFRISDWYQFNISDHKKGNYLLLKTTKTSQWVTVPIHSRLKRTLELVAANPLTLKEPQINSCLKRIAPKMGISKSLSTHSARRSFAITVCLERGVSSETAAELMGITLAVFVKNYSSVTPQKIKAETEKAWKGL